MAIAVETQKWNVNRASGTPAFFINGRPLSGTQPFEAFTRIIDEEIALKKN